MDEAIMHFPREDELWDDDRETNTYELFAINSEVHKALHRDVATLSGYVTQMGRMMMEMQHRLDELEEKQKLVTLSHEEVLQVMALIRMRADEYCEKYALTDRKDVTAIRGAIKKSVLHSHGVKDLHDMPAIARPAVETQIGRWTDIRMVMKIRDKHRTSGA